MIFPLPSNRVWRSYQGGHLLDGNPDSHWPEDWIASTTRAINPGRDEPNAGISRVEFDEKSVLLPDLIAQNPAFFLGEKYLEKFGEGIIPLVKFLDSAVRLHIQCHPTMPFSQRHFNSNFGKTEAYHILEVRPENPHPFIYLGFQNPPTRQQMSDWVETQNIAAIESCFEPIAVAPGETYFVPGGLPHAIGAGVLMVEVMEPTDFVARFEFQKSGYQLPEAARFMGRDIEFGLDMLDFSRFSVEQVREEFQPKPQKIDANRELLLGAPQTSAFQLEKWTINGAIEWPHDGFSIAIILKGQCRIETSEGKWQFGPREKFFVAAGARNLRIEGEAEILLCLPPL